MDNQYNNQGNGNFPNGNQPFGNDNDKKPKKKMKMQAKVILTVTGALAIGMLGGAIYQFSSFAGDFVNNYSTSSSLEEKLKQDSYVNKDPLKNTTILSDVSTEDSVTKVVEENMPSVVSITSQFSRTITYFGQQYKQNSVGSGSGIIIDENDKEYFIATNNHVVADASKIDITLCDDKTVQAKVKGRDSDGDLAVVVIKKADMKESTMKAIKVAKIGDSNSIKVGDKVVAIGNALGLGQSATVGYISALNREVTIEDKKMNLIQTDAAINGGNSGGALLNMNGEIVGINSAKLVDNDIEGMCYAIPISNAQAILSELMISQDVKKGEEGYLGLVGITVTTEENTMFKIPIGARVQEVVEGGAASKAGLYKGDVITKVNGISVNTMEALKQRVASYKAGTELTLTIERYDNGEYKEQDVKLTLMSKKDFDKLKFSTESEDAIDVPKGNAQPPEEQQPNEGNGGNGNQNPNGGEFNEDDFYNYFKDFFNR